MPAPLPAVDDIGGAPPAFFDARALRREVISPVADRDPADRGVLGRYRELGPERFQVLGPGWRYVAEELTAAGSPYKRLSG